MTRRGEREARESRLASGWIVEGDADPEAPSGEVPAGDAGRHPVAAVGAGDVDAGDADAAAEAGAETAEPPRQMSTGILIVLGVLGGLYLIYTWVWFSWANYYSSINAAIAESSGVLGSVLQQIVFWAAPLAPILWFLAVVAVVRTSRPRALVTWLLIGAVVLVPLPMFSSGGG